MTIEKVLPVIPVSDLPGATAWYASFFDRSPDRTPMDSLAEWDVTSLGIVQVFHNPDDAGHTAVNFFVDDLDAHLSELSSRDIGATEPMVVSQGRQRLATCTDPDGNRVTLIESIN